MLGGTLRKACPAFFFGVGISQKLRATKFKLDASEFKFRRIS